MNTKQPVPDPPPEKHINGDYRIEHDGWAVWCDVEHLGAGPGLCAHSGLGNYGQPWLVDREEWDAAHPGVEPTPEALAKAADDAVEILDDRVQSRLDQDARDYCDEDA